MKATFTSTPNITIKWKQTFLERIYVLGNVYFQPLCGLSAELVIRSP